MPYGFFADLIAGFHTTLILYFLFGWLIPFANLRTRALSAFVIGIIFAFFHFFSACPLTVWEYSLRTLANEPVIDETLMMRLGQAIGLTFNQRFLTNSSFIIIIGITLVALLVTIRTTKKWSRK